MMGGARRRRETASEKIHKLARRSAHIEKQLASANVELYRAKGTFAGKIASVAAGEFADFGCGHPAVEITRVAIAAFREARTAYEALAAAIEVGGLAAVAHDPELMVRVITVETQLMCLKTETVAYRRLANEILK